MCSSAIILGFLAGPCRQFHSVSSLLWFQCSTMRHEISHWLPCTGPLLLLTETYRESWWPKMGPEKPIIGFLIEVLNIYITLNYYIWEFTVILSVSKYLLISSLLLGAVIPIFQLENGYLKVRLTYSIHKLSNLSLDFYPLGSASFLFEYVTF